jgi:uncharacterized protein (DUF2141 family)
MMRKWILVAVTLSPLVIALCPPAGAQPPAAAPTAEASLIIEVLGFTDATGNATLGLLASEDDFKSVDLRKDRKNFLKYFCSLQDTRIVRVGNDMVATFKIDHLNPGDYVALSFHDKNRNGKVDANLIGVPVEPFGFSNDVRPQMLPIPKSPTWKATAFTVKAGENRIRMHVKN